MEIIRMFMQPENLIWGIINFSCYWAFFSYLLHSIKNKANLYQAGFILAALASLMIITCPIINKIVSCANA